MLAHTYTNRHMCAKEIYELKQHNKISKYVNLREVASVGIVRSVVVVVFSKKRKICKLSKIFIIFVQAFSITAFKKGENSNVPDSK